MENLVMQQVGPSVYYIRLARNHDAQCVEAVTNQINLWKHEQETGNKDKPFIIYDSRLVVTQATAKEALAAGAFGAVWNTGGIMQIGSNYTIEMLAKHIGGKLAFFGVNWLFATDEHQAQTELLKQGYELYPEFLSILSI